MKIELKGFGAFRADTMVELADGESFIIGGLVSRSTMSSVSQVPLLGSLPILGTFFKNLNYSQDETELVIIVTPRLVQPLPANTDLEAMLPGARCWISARANSSRLFMAMRAAAASRARIASATIR